MSLSQSDLSKLQSKRVEDNLLAQILCNDLGIPAPKRLPQQVIREICSTDFISTSLKEQILERQDRAVVASVSTSLRPNAIVETGTSDGLSSIIFLYSLMLNKKGYLYSIDLPHLSTWTESKNTGIDEVGFSIPRQYKGRFVSVLEDSKRSLQRVLLETKPRIFIHDSLHTVTHMLYEYSMARALMAPKSLIASDDILWNKAFISFCEATGCKYYVSGSNPNYGFAIVDIEADDLGVWGSYTLDEYLSLREKS